MIIRRILIVLLCLFAVACGLGKKNGDENVSPTVNFSASITSGDAPLTIEFDASNSSDPDGSIESYIWDFGNGETGNGKIIEHIYALEGIFTVTLTVIDNEGASANTTQTVTVNAVSNISPIVSFIVTPATGLAPLDVNLDATASSDPDGSISSYSWDFGDGEAGSGATAAHTYTTAGTFTISLTISDNAGATVTETKDVIVGPPNQPPTATFTATPTNGEVPLTISFDASASTDANDSISSYVWDFGDGETGVGVNINHVFQSTGIFTVTLTVTDENSASAAFSSDIEVFPAGSNQPPNAKFSSDQLSGEAPVTISFDAAASTDVDGNIKNYAWDFGDGETGDGIQTQHTYNVAGTYTVLLTVTDNRGDTSQDSVIIRVRNPNDPPPDPKAVAPVLNKSVSTTMYNATAFLFSGPDPIQTGVSENTIEAKRIAVLRGKIADRDGQALSSVTISILDHAEYGQTLSREDGLFDLAVNGGTTLTVNYEKVGYLSIQRQVNIPWKEFVWSPDVIMIPVDNQVTTVDLSSSGMQVARGSVVNDADGSRQSTLLIPDGTSAELVMADGSKQAISTLNIRSTEYTVGDNGPNTMPAQLPPTSGYTYAFELSADEAINAGASSVEFNQTLYHYVEDFIGFDVGSRVPVGYYDRNQGKWIASKNGLVIKILGTNGGLADIDSNGDNIADDITILTSLNFTDAERQQLASLYSADQTLWRVPITHFTPWDCNWPFGPPPGSGGPPGGGNGNGDGDEDDEDACDCVIEYQTQVLRESIPLSGIPFSLNYRSDRVPGRKSAYQTKILLSEESIPEPLKRIELQVGIAGQEFSSSFPAETNQSYTYTWDGLDAYDRPLQGAQTASIRVGYVFDAIYQTPAELEESFGRYSGEGVDLDGNRAREEITIWQEYKTGLGIMDTSAQGLGGWSIDPFHIYDYDDQTIYRGDGIRRSSNVLQAIITTLAGSSNTINFEDGMPAVDYSFNPFNVEAAPDGGFFVATLSYIFYVNAEGMIFHYAGKWRAGTGFSGDGGPATDALLENIGGMALAPDGSLYFTDGRNNRVRVISPDGIINTFAGDGTALIDFPPEEGVPATETSIYSPVDVAIAPDGGVYIAQWIGGYIRHVGPDGLISTVAGGQPWGSFDDNVPATQIYLAMQDIEVGPDGSVFTESNNRVWQITSDGIAHIIAGLGQYAFDVEGVPAKEAQIGDPEGIEVAPDGSIYLSYGAIYGNIVRRITPDGLINTFAGNGEYGSRQYDFENAPALAAGLNRARDVSIGPDNEIYIVDSYHVHKITPAIPGFSVDNLLLPSENGNEIFVFNLQGQHLKTLETNTGALSYQFNYDDNNLLSNITDVYGNVTTFERSESGDLSAIVGPYDFRTEITLDENKYISSITDPAGDNWSMTYANDGLLLSITNPNEATLNFTYDTVGRITRDDEPNGGFFDLSRSESATGFEVSIKTAENRNTVVAVERLADTTISRTYTYPDGAANNLNYGSSGLQRFTYANGTISTTQLGPGPRFGMLSPLIQSYSKTTPDGLILNYSSARTVSFEEAADILRPATIETTQTINGQQFSKLYSAADKTITRTTPEGREMVNLLDENGRVIEYRIDTLATIFLDYDDRGRLHQLRKGSDDAERILSLTHNSDGFAESLTDPMGRITSYDFDAVGRITGISRPGLLKAQFGYDKRGNLVSFTPPGRSAHLFSYNSLNYLTEYNPPDVSGSTESTTFNYNLDSQLASTTKPGGRFVTFAYDDGGRLETTTLARGVIRYAYDPDSGSLSRATSPAGSVDYDYDGGLIKTIEWSGLVAGQITQTFDNFFRLNSRSVNADPAVNFSYDNDSLILTAGDLSITRNAVTGLIESTSIGNVTDSWLYNEFGELDFYSYAYSDSDVFSLDYSRDKLGRITQSVEVLSGSTITYDYDYEENGRISVVKKNGNTIASYEYDDNGNRSSYTDAADIATTATYDDQDRLLTYGTVNYSYHADGSLLNKTAGSDVTTYEYDELNNLISVTQPNGDVIRYLIDGRNRRIGKRLNDTLVQAFLYKDKLKPIAELDGSGTVVNRFVYGSKSNVPDYMIRDGVNYRIISDHLGSPRFIVNVATGVVEQQMSYDVFGKVIEDSNPGFQPFGFAGGLYDPDTGLLRFGVRDYDAETGRWTAQDPRYFCGMCTNLYAYVNNDPINRSDPSGLGEGDCDDPSDDCNGRSENREERERESWRRSRVDFSIPYWLDSVIGTVGAVLGTASEVAPTVLGAAGSALGVLTWPIAFEGARQTADTLARELIEEPIEWDQQEIDQLYREIFRDSSDRGGSDCP